MASTARRAAMGEITTATGESVTDPSRHAPTDNPAPHPTHYSFQENRRGRRIVRVLLDKETNDKFHDSPAERQGSCPVGLQYI